MWYIDTLYIKHIEEDIFINDIHYNFNSICQYIFRAIVTLYCLNINGKIEWHIRYAEIL